jgi:hypothetical protein
MSSVGIHSKTKVGDEVFDGGVRSTVTHRFGDVLVLRAARTGDFYTRNIEGGGRRWTSEQDAINAATLPIVAAQVAIHRAQGAA